MRKKKKTDVRAKFFVKGNQEILDWISRMKGQTEFDSRGRGGEKEDLNRVLEEEVTGVKRWVREDTKRNRKRDTQTNSE